MNHDPRDVKDGLLKVLARENLPKEFLWVRHSVREALDYIRQLEADLRRQGFAEYDTGEE